MADWREGWAAGRLSRQARPARDPRARPLANVLVPWVPGRSEGRGGTFA